MFVGHFGVGLIAKRLAPKTSLGTTVLSAVLPDALFSVFLLAGVEHAAIQAGITAVSPLDLYDFPLSHSLLLDVFWAAAFAAVYSWKRSDRRGAWVLFGAVLSHWVLDWVSHRPDMPLAPGVDRYVGLGLWHSLAATFVVEGSLWLASVIIYAHITSGKSRAGVFGFWIMIVLLTALWIAGLGGAPPPNTLALATSNLALGAVVVAWAYWVDRRREIVAGLSPDGSR